MKTLFSLDFSCTRGFRGETFHVSQRQSCIFIRWDIFHLGLKDKILTCFQLLSSQYPKPSVRITNKQILKERLLDTTIYLVYRLCTLT